MAARNEALGAQLDQQLALAKGVNLPARSRRSLEQQQLATGGGEPRRNGQAGETGSDDDDARRAHGT